MAKKKNGTGTKVPAEIEERDEFHGLVKVDTLRELVETNIGGGTVSSFDLDRIQIPTGGSTIWTIPTLEGEDGCKELDGIVVHMADPRAYWSQGFDESGGGTPPDCSSEDGMNGYGVRSEGEAEGHHQCHSCPLAQFGSDERGRGQACKAQKAVFMLMQDTLLPVVLILPPTSLGEAKKYFLRLLSHGEPAHGVVTRWTLDKEQNPDGIKFSKAKPVTLRRLDKDEKKAVTNYTATIKPYLESRSLTEPLPAEAPVESADESSEDSEEE